MRKLIRRTIAGLLFLPAAMMVTVPAFAQIDFSGEWTQWIQQGETDPRMQETGETIGIPLNAEGRAGSDNHNLSSWGLPEYQCRPHPATFYWRGTGENRVTKVVDPVSRETTAFRVERRRNFDQLVYLDGRPHPPAWAAHTWGGFSTGKWMGNVLTVTTTHIKDGYLGMNGMVISDQATIIERWIRHGDYLHVIQSISDPVYLSEPLVLSQQFRLNLEQRLPVSPCVVIEESPLPKGVVPHNLPGTNTWRTDWVDRHKIPRQVLDDGAETMYPEYQAKLKKYYGARNAK
jgi:hypothetical protein